VQLIASSSIKDEWRDAVCEERAVRHGGLKRRPAITRLGADDRGVKVRLPMLLSLQVRRGRTWRFRMLGAEHARTASKFG
jgi:hypothetical protein